MWGIITFAVCFMLACVMLISGNGNIGEVRNSIQDTIITKEIDAQLEKRAINYYRTAEEGLEKFDSLFTQNASDTVAFLTYCANPQGTAPEMTTEAGKTYASAIGEWQAAMPDAASFSSYEEYLVAMQSWQDATPATQETAIATAYAAACEELQKEYESSEEMLGCVMYALNPNGTFDEFYTENNETVPEDYDVVSLLTGVSKEDRAEYRQERAEFCSSVFLAGNMSSEDSVKALTDALSSYGVTEEKYNSFGYDYATVKHMAATAVVTYRGRLDYETGLLDDSASVSETADKLTDDISSSFLSTLPDTVSEALEEIGQADLYTLIVGSIFYKLAGLLLPIIYMIMASNNLVAGQVDSGSMAYVLSTSTKRVTVVFTQAVYLVGSILTTFALTTATGCVCLSIVSEDVELTYDELLLLNLGAFLVLFALSGLCFFTSCIFDRSKRSMAIGGGLSIFALVAAMLGLFGSPVIPSVIRLEALNNFNYTTVISLFDVVSIIDGTDTFIYKFAILAVLGIIGYVTGSIRFTKKDLPL